MPLLLSFDSSSREGKGESEDTLLCFRSSTVEP